MTKSSSQSGRLVMWGIVALAVVGVLIWKSTQIDPNLTEAVNDQAVGQQFPMLELRPLTGTAEGLSLDDLKGKVALINYWGTWCGPCKKELPRLAELWDRYRGTPGFILVAISCGQGSPENVELVRRETKEFLKAEGVTMPTYIDVNGDSQQKFAKLTGNDDIEELPLTVMLDRQGTVRAAWRGYRDGQEQTMEQMLSKLLAER